VCRLLYVRAVAPFASRSHLGWLAIIAKHSKVYQGHGWGCAWLEAGDWRTYRSIRPIWEDDLTMFPDTTLLLAHARSAFRDEGIRVENNMPFFDGNYAFIFNGELQGVRIREDGRIGAEKLFNYVKRFDEGDLLTAMTKAIDIVAKRTRYVRALNLIMADRHNAYVASHFAEDPDYFQLRRYRGAGLDIVCSEPYADFHDWQRINNGTVERLQNVTTT